MHQHFFFQMESVLQGKASPLLKPSLSERVSKNGFNLFSQLENYLQEGVKALPPVKEDFSLRGLASERHHLFS